MTHTEHRMRTRMSGILSSDVENRVDDEGRPFLEQSLASDDTEYDNSKNLRRGAESLLDMVKTPSEIVQSLSDVSFVLLRDLLISVALFFFGVHGPKRFILPLIGGLTMRPIPYQTTQAGDILLDLTLSNEFIDKSDVTFTCEFEGKCFLGSRTTRLTILSQRKGSGLSGFGFLSFWPA